VGFKVKRFRFVVKKEGKAVSGKGRAGLYKRAESGL